MYGGVIPELQHVHKHGVPAWVRREVVPSTLLLLCNVVSLQQKAARSSTRDRTALFIESVSAILMVMETLGWLLQFVASSAWVISVFVYGSFEHGDIWQLTAAFAWTMSNLCVGVELFSTARLNPKSKGGVIESGSLNDALGSSCPA